MKTPCIIEGCTHNAAPNRQWCWSHYWRHREGKPVDAPLRPYGRSPKQAFMDAVGDFTEADPLDKEEYERKKARVIVYAYRMVKGSSRGRKRRR